MPTSTMEITFFGRCEPFLKKNFSSSLLDKEPYSKLASPEVFLVLLKGESKKGI